MKRTMLIGVVVCFAAVAVLSREAFARNRMYNPSLGRWMQRDPAGTQQAPPMARNVSSAQFTQPDSAGQYADGPNLYQYVGSNPGRRVDPVGLWGTDVHQVKTSEWAKSRDHGMVGWAADMAGKACNDVDPFILFWPFITTSANLSWHFDIPHDRNLVWGPSDSRYIHAEKELKGAISWCDERGGGRPRNDADVHEALKALGRSLHPTQDWVAHGTWDPTWESWFNWRAHPGDTDNFSLDYANSRDGLLRDVERDGMPAGSNQQFVVGNKRADLTKQRTLEILRRFKNGLDKAGWCYCRIYMLK